MNMQVNDVMSYGEETRDQMEKIVLRLDSYQKDAQVFHATNSVAKQERDTLREMIAELHELKQDKAPLPARFTQIEEN